MHGHFQNYRRWPRLLTFSIVLASSAAAGGAEPAKSAPDYLTQIKPLLTQHCVTCHGAQKPRSGLRLDTAAAAVVGGKSGPAIRPGNGDDSSLILSLRGEGSGERMPLNRPALPEAEILLLKTWIDQGAQAPAHEIPSVAPTATHWAFQPPTRPVPPHAMTGQPSYNAIDSFIHERLARAGLAPSPEADRATLLRRVSLDLIGLPPTPAEIDAFSSDRSPMPYERVVDRLLASPHFGERWARPWLDMARYADSNGYSIDAPRSIWKYRDWIISALNANVPFDRYATEQLAGDLLPAPTLNQRIATGFHRNTAINGEGGIDVEQFRIESIVDRVNTTGTVFLGLTVGCAQCHDHKYDPISQREYYQFFAFFNNCDEPNLEISTPAELESRRKTLLEIDAFHEQLAAKHQDLQKRVSAWESTLSLEFRTAQSADVQAAFGLPIEKRSRAQQKALIELMMATAPDFRSEFARLQKLRDALPKFITTMVVSERAGIPRASHIHLGGDFTRKGAPVQPAVPVVLPHLVVPSAKPQPNRLDLARWLFSGDNPLTGRVFVNRLWQTYFGRGLVETDNDFGTQGTPPSHPELLDWLTHELEDQQWNSKAIHRLIVTSATYRQSSRSTGPATSIDPGNRLLWRQSRLRLDAEVIRDAALSASHQLTKMIGGPSVFPPQPDGVMNLGQMRRPWIPDTGPNRYRRGLYTYFWRATPFAFLTTFDAPAAIQSCTRRTRSDTPLQALTLLNDPAFIELAHALANRIHSSADTDSTRLENGFRICLGRLPSSAELRVLERLLQGKPSSETTRSNPQDWLAVARTLLNLDEFLTRE